MQTLTAPIYVSVSATGLVLTVSTDGALALDYSPGELIGRPVTVLLHPDDHLRFQQVFGDCIQQSRSGALGEFSQVGKDGIGCLKQVQVQFLQDADLALTALLVFESIRKPSSDRDLYKQMQILNSELERQTQIRAIQLKIAFEFEATLKRITDKVRDSLDENQILQTVVQELAIAIGVSCCNAALYDRRSKTSTICYEYTTTPVPFQGRIVHMEACPELYAQLTRGETFQFCSIHPSPVRGHVAMLACPILDDQAALGDLWLIHHKYYAFSEQDMRLVQQVANHCAIAIRQARLYQASQKQIELLEKLNQLKDDFLSTVSHELRTPMANMRMAMQMLTIALGREGLLNPQNPEVTSNKIAHYLQILQDECRREISLINDLLDLQRLEAGARSLHWETIQLQHWLPGIIQPFQECTQSQDQFLWVDVPLSMPPVLCDADCLERILRELLTNAYKYTPKGGEIRVSADLDPQKVSLTVQNSGVQIPDSELPRVFDKFYRVPNNDPWKHGGTGLGLALVRQLVEHLGAEISVTSGNHQTSFTIVVPRRLPPQEFHTAGGGESG